MSDDPEGGAERTFTKGELAKAVAAAVRSKVAEVRAEYADYDELKSAAAAAGQSKTQLDKMAEQLAALTDRATKAEATNLRNEVLTSKLKGVPASLTKHLQGKTKEELESAAEEMLADWKEAGGKVDDGTDTSAAPAAAAPARGRPREDLRSGAPVSQTPPEETNPLKLAALIPRH